MCRMIIAIGKIECKTLINDLIRIADGDSINPISRQLKKKHVHGWGIAYLDHDEQWHTYRSLTPIFKDKKIEEFSKIEAKMIILHVRHATRGSTDLIENNMPFKTETEQGKYFFSHNGTIDDNLSFNKQYYQGGNTDSTRWFNYLLSNMKEANADEAKNCLNNLEHYNSANFFLITPKKIIIGQKFKEKPDYFALRMLRSENSTIISSEILPTLKNKEWETIENNSVFEIDYSELIRKNTCSIKIQ